MNEPLIYDPKFVTSLFDEMAKTYGIVNLISSFGFTVWWRRACARGISTTPNSVVVDLMTGMGELCGSISKQMGCDSELIAVDISSAMCAVAEKHRFQHRYRVVQADALQCPLEDSSADFVFSCFGLKTFNEQQLGQLASEVKRILRPGGQYSFLEISVPSNWALRLPYMFYLNHVVPVIGRILLGNPENYRLLGVYTGAFRNCDQTAKLFEASGLSVEKRSHFFGCATSITGQNLH